MARHQQLNYIRAELKFRWYIHCFECTGHCSNEICVNAWVTPALLLDFHTSYGLFPTLWPVSIWTGHCPSVSVQYFCTILGSKCQQHSYIGILYIDIFNDTFTLLRTYNYCITDIKIVFFPLWKAWGGGCQAPHHKPFPSDADLFPVITGSGSCPKTLWHRSHKQVN